MLLESSQEIYFEDPRYGTRSLGVYRLGIRYDPFVREGQSLNLSCTVENMDQQAVITFFKIPLITSVLSTVEAQSPYLLDFYLLELALRNPPTPSPTPFPSPPTPIFGALNSSAPPTTWTPLPTTDPIKAKMYRSAVQARAMAAVTDFENNARFLLDTKLDMFQYLNLSEKVTKILERVGRTNDFWASCAQDPGGVCNFSTPLVANLSEGARRANRSYTYSISNVVPGDSAVYGCRIAFFEKDGMTFIFGPPVQVIKKPELITFVGTPLQELQIDANTGQDLSSREQSDSVLAFTVSATSMNALEISLEFTYLGVPPIIQKNSDTPNRPPSPTQAPRPITLTVRANLTSLNPQPAIHYVIHADEATATRLNRTREEALRMLPSTTIYYNDYDTEPLGYFWRLAQFATYKVPLRKLFFEGLPSPLQAPIPNGTLTIGVRVRPEIEPNSVWLKQSILLRSLQGPFVESQSASGQEEAVFNCSNTSLLAPEGGNVNITCELKLAASISSSKSPGASAHRLQLLVRMPSGVLLNCSEGAFCPLLDNRYFWNSTLNRSGDGYEKLLLYFEIRSISSDLNLFSARFQIITGHQVFSGPYFTLSVERSNPPPSESPDLFLLHVILIAGGSVLLVLLLLFVGYWLISQIILKPLARRRRREKRRQRKAAKAKERASAEAGQSGATDTSESERLRSGGQGSGSGTAAGSGSGSGQDEEESSSYSDEESESESNAEADKITDRILSKYMAANDSDSEEPVAAQGDAGAASGHRNTAGTELEQYSGPYPDQWMNTASGASSSIPYFTRGTAGPSMPMSITSTSANFGMVSRLGQHEFGPSEQSLNYPGGPMRISPGGPIPQSELDESYDETGPELKSRNTLVRFQLNDLSRKTSLDSNRDDPRFAESSFTNSIQAGPTVPPKKSRKKSKELKNSPIQSVALIGPNSNGNARPPSIQGPSVPSRITAVAQIESPSRHARNPENGFAQEIHAPGNSRTITPDEFNVPVTV